MTQVDQSPKVFGIGLNKTGTTTLGRCFVKLGYNHCSFHGPLMIQYGSGNLQAAMDFAAKFNSFEDWPWPLLYRRLSERYPTAKFILTIRMTPAIWLRSITSHSKRVRESEFRTIAYGKPNPEENEEEYLATYLAHNREVMEYFAKTPDRLISLCWEKGDDWIKLCDFLGKPVPKDRFPHLNKSPDLRK